MDKPIISYDSFDGGLRQVHRVTGKIPSELEAFGLGIIHTSRRQRGGELDQPAEFRRSFDFYCLSHLLEGRGIYRNFETGHCSEISAGDLVMVMPGTRHIYGGDKSFYLEDSICFCGRIADSLRTQGILADGVFSCGPVRRIARIIEVALEPTLFAQIKAATMLQQLLLELHAENLELSVGNSSAFSALLVEIGRTPERWWTVREMARECGLSESHFRRAFHAYTGMSPKLYLDRMKLQLAAEMLVSTSLTLAQVAARFGYMDPFHFSRRFKALNGLSPDAYRRHYRMR